MDIQIVLTLGFVIITFIAIQVIRSERAGAVKPSAIEEKKEAETPEHETIAS
ncbi:MAG: hypothetical protein ACM3RX_07295 [Methanococcaceae archaeon]